MYTYVFQGVSFLEVFLSIPTCFYLLRRMYRMISHPFLLYFQHLSHAWRSTQTKNILVLCSSAAPY